MGRGGEKESGSPGFFYGTRRVGEIMEADREAGKLAEGTRGSKVKGARVSQKPTLIDQGVDKNLADRARKAAAQPAAPNDQLVSACQTT
jgi:hypothetical protein